MAAASSRRGGNPIIVSSDNTSHTPQRISFTDRTIEEGWLQGLLATNPELLPVDEIEPVFAPLICIGREVDTSAGPIDNMYISPQGYLTIVETKLWRNPEARREVVGQIIDYATAVSQWTYEDLDNKARKHDSEHRGIIELISPEKADERDIVDTISRNLERGRFLLLIVGDGIRESVEDMVAYLQQTPQLLFTLALVELQVYELEEGANRPLLVIPQIVARTREVTRAVVRVEASEIKSIHVEVDTEIKAGAKSTITEEAFFQELRDFVDAEDAAFAEELKKDMEKRACIIDWKQASFVVKLPDPRGSGINLSLLVVPTNGQVYIRSELADQLRSIGLPEQIAEDYAKESARLFSGCHIHKQSPYKWSRAVSLKELRQHYEAFSSLVQKTINRIEEATSA